MIGDDLTILELSVLAMAVRTYDEEARPLRAVQVEQRFGLSAMAAQSVLLDLVKLNLFADVCRADDLIVSIGKPTDIARGMLPFL